MDEVLSHLASRLWLSFFSMTIYFNCDSAAMAIALSTDPSRLFSCFGTSRL